MCRRIPAVTKLTVSGQAMHNDTKGTMRRPQLSAQRRGIQPAQQHATFSSSIARACGYQVILKVAICH